MWLLPVFALVSRACTGIFYRVTVSGRGRIPPTGPALVVANHPNSLVDPMLVVAAADRPIRFLAKAPLFSDPLIGWAVRASGSIPVHRQKDDPGRTGDNVHMFRAVHAALHGGSAVGLFPEGISHSEPALTPLKTGAARMALGTAATHGTTFPIIPVGMVLADKTRFRSEAHVIIGDAIDWTDLAGRSDEDREAVHDLTERIAAGLQTVTVNLDAWTDQPLVECANLVWAAETDASLDPGDHVGRTATIAAVLADHRANPTPEGTRIIEHITRHRRRLRRAGLTPADLHANVSWWASIPWLFKRLAVVPLSIIGLIGKLLFMIPYHVAGQIPRFTQPDEDQVSTHKLLYGMAANLVWLILLVAGGWVLAGPVVGLITLAAAPLCAMVAIWTTERWKDSERDIRRFFLFRRNPAFIHTLGVEQQQLAERLRELHDVWAARPSS